MKLENAYQPHVIERLHKTFPGCFVTKVVPPPQGIPDLLIEFGKTWARLETKKSIKEPFRPNQEEYIEMFNEMSFAKMICPENEDYVFVLLEIHFNLYA